MTITTSGVHYWPAFRFSDVGRKVLIDVAGTALQFNGATITFGYKAADGLFSPYLKLDGSPVTSVSRGGFEARIPRSKEVGIEVTVAVPASGGLTLDVVQAVDSAPTGS